MKKIRFKLGLKTYIGIVITYTILSSIKIFEIEMTIGTTYYLPIYLISGPAYIPFGMQAASLIYLRCIRAR